MGNYDPDWDTWCSPRDWLSTRRGGDLQKLSERSGERALWHFTSICENRRGGEARPDKRERAERGAGEDALRVIFRCMWVLGGVAALELLLSTSSMFGKGLKLTDDTGKSRNSSIGLALAGAAL